MDILENMNNLENKMANIMDLKDSQEKFFTSNIGEIANKAIDFGLKVILPDSIENDIIEIKDAFVKGGLKEGISTAVQNAINFGKKVLGIEEREFSDIEQAENAITSGELMSNISSCINDVLQKISEATKISNDILNSIKDGKEEILKNISNDVTNEFESEKKALEKIEKYIDNWEKFYSEKNMEGMKKEYNKIEKQMKKIMPLENVIKNINKIQNINKLIEKQQDFDFDDIYLELAEKI